jgi:hypothetical protein
MYILERDTTKTCASPEEEFYNAVQKLLGERGDEDSARPDAARGALLLLCMFGENKTRSKALSIKALDPEEDHPVKLLAAGRMQEAEKAAEEFSHLYSVYFAAGRGEFSKVKRQYTKYVEPYCPEYLRHYLLAGGKAVDVPPPRQCLACRRVALELSPRGYCTMFCETPDWSDWNDLNGGTLEQ